MLKCCGKIEPKGIRSVVHFSPRGEIEKPLSGGKVIEIAYWEVWDGKDFVEAWNTVELHSANGKFPTEITKQVERRSI